MKLALLFKAIELVEDLIAAIKTEDLTDDERNAMKAKRDGLNQRLAELDVPTAAGDQE